MKNQKNFISLGENKARVSFMIDISSFIKRQGMRVSQAAQEEVKPETDTEWAVFSARLLSATRIWGHGFPMNFSRPGVVQGAFSYFDGNTIYPDHWQSVTTWLGKVENGRYNEDTDPAGLDAELCIHRERTGNRDIILGLEQGTIKHVSVTLDVEWEQSHSMSRDDFWLKVGQEIDGRLVEVLVTRIIAGYEVSLVWLGADHTAMIQQENINLKTEDNMDKMMAILQMVKDASITWTGDAEKDIQTLVTSFNTTLEKLAQVQAQIQLMITQKKESCLALARLLNGQKDPTTEATMAIEAADTLEKLGILESEYQKRKTEKFPATCQHCGKAMAEVRSSVEQPVEEKTGKPPVISPIKSF